MDSQSFLKDLGWPADRLGELGTAEWSAPSEDGFAKLSVGIARESGRIQAWVAHVGLEGRESLMGLDARVEGGQVAVEASHAGSPPEAIPARDAVALFEHMRAGMPLKMKFTSNGPLELPAISSKLRG